MEIDLARLRTDIEENAVFGALDVETGRGRTLLTGSDADKQARERLVDRLEDEGLDVRVDAVGNIAGRWVPNGVDPSSAPVAMGSHLDSVPNGGIFDGPLGVYGALAALRAIREKPLQLTRPVEIVSFTEEEGARFGVGTLGSSVVSGQRSSKSALSLEDETGTSLEERLHEIGFRGEDTIDATEWDAWLELHIEQGTHLETAGTPVGIVEAITGITNCRVVIDGEANHAGSTPMEERKDALTAASEFICDVEQVGQSVANEFPTAVATVGQLAVSPNARNIVPGTVNLTLDIRDVSERRMDRLVNKIRQKLIKVSETRPVEVSFDRFRDDSPDRMSERLYSLAAEAADEISIPYETMNSAARHDTANIASVTDSLLLFAPSTDGISHNPREWTEWEDVKIATQVLARTAASAAANN